MILLFYLFSFYLNRRNIHHIYQLLFYVRRIFYQIDIKNATNLEAAQL